MTSARAIEYQITRDLLSRDAPIARHAPTRIVERLIGVVATAACLLLFGSYMPELVAAGVAASAVWVLGSR